MIAVLRRNAGYKVLSLAIAALLYAIASAQLNPAVSKEMYVVPETIGLPSDMVVKASPPGATVTVTGPSTAVEAFKAQQVKAVVDVSKAGAGANRLLVEYKNRGGQVEISSAPTYTEVVLERKASQPYTVDVLYDDTPPPGLVYTDGIAQPSSVKVTGLASEVRRVSRVVASLDKTPAAGAITQQVELVAQDERQQAVDTVQIEPPRVIATVGVKKAPSAKSMLLSATMTGSPAPGYAVVGYSFTPTMVTVTGLQSLLAARSSLTIPVDIDGLAESVTRTIKIPTPSGLMLHDKGAGTVKIHIDVRRIAQPVPDATPSASAPVPNAAPSAATVPPSVPLKPAP